ncbi:MAG: sigma-70 family RNA polymerase sigma factor [Planctomycetes bacterium]|nr:sigma-70 family RNA polymerase sigma factor [Planctomycetota bacterium]
MRSPTPPDDDRQKRLRLKAGDPEAFAELFREQQPGILNYVYRLSGGNSPLAEDVSQQVFMSFWTHRNEYDLDKPLTPLLLTMARNAWLNAAKREEYRKTSELKEDGASGQDRGIERKELESAIEKSLASLDEPIREVFILSRYHGLKYTQIAQMMGISVKTVEARLSRALQDLQKLLKDFL